MKANVKLKLQQAEMRSCLRLDRRQRSPEMPSPEMPSPDSSGLRRAITALILVYGRGWSAADIAHHFGWPREAVERWLETGKPLL